MSFQINEFYKTLKTIRIYESFIPFGTRFYLNNILLLEGDMKNIDSDIILKNYKMYAERANVGNKELDEEFRFLAREKYLSTPEETRRLDYANDYAFNIMNDKYGSGWQKNGISPKVVKTNIITTDTNNILLNNIVLQINRYLIRNRGSVADFNLLRDIVDRNLDTVENEISVSIPVPIYLGLIGTMAGIVFGLFAIPGDFFTSSVDTDISIAGSSMTNIAPLINGVKYAMSVSCIGLALTLFNSGFKFKMARIIVDRSKNSFFNFLQTELLPVLSESMNTGIINLNRRLENFGKTFEQQIASLEGIAEKTSATMASQLSILKKVQEIDPIKIAQFNIKAYQELLQSIDKITYFTEELNRLNHLFGNINSLVERTSNIDEVAQSIKLSLDQAADIQKFFHSHFSSLEDGSRKFTAFLANQNSAFSDSITDIRVNAAMHLEEYRKQMSEDFDVLKDYLGDKITSIKELKITEDDLMIKAYEENKEALKNLKLLTDLKKNTDGISKLNDINASLTKLSNDVSSMKSIINQNAKAKQKGGVVTIEPVIIQEDSGNTPITKSPWQKIVSFFNKRN